MQNAKCKDFYFTVRKTKTQTIQYRMIHIIIPCNKWLYNIKIRNNKIIDFCIEIDDISHSL